MGKIPESTSFKISDFIFRFRESSQKFVVEILTQNFAFNLSGTLFFIGLGCSLKWWYKDQLLITLLKQNLPAFSQPQQKISWETGEYLIGEQTRQFLRKKQKNNEIVLQSNLLASKAGQGAQVTGALHGAHERNCKEMGVKNSEMDLFFTPQMRNNYPCSFSDLIDRVDVYSNSVVINFRSPWQKHAYHRFVGLFPELICADTARTDEMQVSRLPSNLGFSEASEDIFSAPNSLGECKKAISSTSTKFVHSVFQKKKYTFLCIVSAPPPKNWFKLSARGLCILNDVSPSSSTLLQSKNYFGVQHESTLQRLGAMANTFFRKPLIQTLEFPFNAVCEIPEKKIVVSSSNKNISSAPLVKIVNEKKDALAAPREHDFAPLCISSALPSQFASSVRDRTSTLLSIEKSNVSLPSVKKTPLFCTGGGAEPMQGRTATELLHSRILNKGLAELSVIVNNQFFVDGINFPTTKTIVMQSNMSPTYSKVDNRRLGRQTTNFSYPLELTSKMNGWQPPVQKIILNSYLDEIPYKLENTLWATTRQIDNRRLGLFNSNDLFHQYNGDVKKKDQTLIKSTKKLDKGCRVTGTGSLIKEKLPAKLGGWVQSNLVCDQIHSLHTEFEEQRCTNTKKGANKMHSRRRFDQLIEIKQLLINELQILVNSLPVIFVDRSSRSESNNQANNVKSHIRDAQKKGTWLTPNSNSLHDWSTFDGEQFCSPDSNALLESPLHLPVRADEIMPLREGEERVHELDRHKEEKSTQQKASHEYTKGTSHQPSPFVSKEKEKKNAFDVLDIEESTKCISDAKPLLSGSQTKSSALENSFSLLNSLGITFNNLSYLKDPPVLLPMNQDASFWKWNKKKVGEYLRYPSFLSLLGQYTEGVKKTGVKRYKEKKISATQPYAHQEYSLRFAKFGLNSHAKQDNSNLVTDTTFRFDPNTMTWQVLQQLNCGESFQNTKTSRAPKVQDVSHVTRGSASLGIGCTEGAKKMHPQAEGAKQVFKVHPNETSEKMQKERAEKKPLVQKTTWSAKRVHFINQIILKQKKSSFFTPTLGSLNSNREQGPALLAMSFAEGNLSSSFLIHKVTGGASQTASPFSFATHIPSVNMSESDAVQSVGCQRQPLHLLSNSLLAQCTCGAKVHECNCTRKELQESELELKAIGELRKIENINPVDTQVSLTNKRVRLMSGYIYPDTQSVSLMPNFYRWTYSAFPLGGTCNTSGLIRLASPEVLSPITLTKSTEKPVGVNSRGSEKEFAPLDGRKTGANAQLPPDANKVGADSQLVKKANFFSIDGDKNLTPLIHDWLLDSKKFRKITRLGDNACLFKVCTSGTPTTLSYSRIHSVNTKENAGEALHPGCTIFSTPNLHASQQHLHSAPEKRNKWESSCASQMQLTDKATFHAPVPIHSVNQVQALPLIDYVDSNRTMSFAPLHPISNSCNCIRAPLCFASSVQEVNSKQGTGAFAPLQTSLHPECDAQRCMQIGQHQVNCQNKNAIGKLPENSLDDEKLQRLPFLIHKVTGGALEMANDIGIEDTRLEQWNFDHHLGSFPGFIKPNQFILSINQIAQGNNLSEDSFTHFYDVSLNSNTYTSLAKRGRYGIINSVEGVHEIKQNLTQTGATAPSSQPFDCSPRKTAYNGIVVQRNPFTKDFQLSKKKLERHSILGTFLFGPENPFTDRQSHFFGQRRLSTVDVNVFQRDYLRQLGKETLLQSNPKEFTYGASVERGKILSFSKAINSFLSNKRRYTYLLEEKDQWHLLFQEQLRTALEDTRKYPPLTPEESKDYSPGRIKVSAPLMMARFPKKSNCHKVLAHYNEWVDNGLSNGHRNLHSPIDMHLINDASNQPLLCSFFQVHRRCKEDFTAQVQSNSIFTETYSSQYNSAPLLDQSSFALGNSNLAVFLGQQWFTQEPLNANSWLIISQWSFLVALLFWIEQTFLADIFPALFALEQLLLGTTGMKSDDRTHVTRVSKGEIPKFKDIAGIDGLLGELAELVLFLRGHKKRLWNKKSSYGVLLTGPPGTGKTFLVRALANEAKVPVLILSAGVLTANKTNNSKPSWSIRHAFRRAKQLAPCILFIDEIDALGRSRGNIVTDINEIVADAKGGQNVQATPLSNSNFFEMKNSFQFHLPSVQLLSNEKATLANTSLQQQLLSATETQVHQIQGTKSLRELASQGKSISAYNQIDRYSLCADTSWLTNAFPFGHKSPTLGSETKIPSIGDKTLSTGSYTHSSHQPVQSMQTKENIKRKFGPLTQLLVSMDGVSSLAGVLIIGATNRPESLDPALTRPGRFERIIRVEKPAEQKRIEILKLYSRNLGIQKQIPWSYLANRTMGLTAADLAVAMNYSSLKAILQGTMHTIETIEYGLDSIARFSSREVKQKQSVINKK